MIYFVSEIHTRYGRAVMAALDGRRIHICLEQISSAAGTPTQTNDVTDSGHGASVLVYEHLSKEDNMKRNEASWDRIARVILGIALIIGGLAAVGGAIGYVLAAVGLIPLATGLVGWCPIYAILGVGTCKLDAGIPAE